MSSTDIDSAATLIGAAPGSSPSRQPMRRPRLELIYFALAGFDLLTIVFTLFLSNHIMDLYQQSVARGGAWSARVGELVELAQYAQQANAPGNDVFDTQDVAAERLRRDASLLRYNEQRDRVLHELESSVPGAEAHRISSRIRAADLHMTAMMQEADHIFAQIEVGDDVAAGRRMATMDRVYGRLSNSLLEAIYEVQQVEDANLRRQVRLAANMRQLELVVMVLIFGIVIGVALYGRKIGEVMRRTEDAHNAMLLELEAANEGLQQYADNVAHELRNPINKMLLASEVALSRTRSTEEYQEALVSIVEESQRLSGIVGSLLFLARARRTRVELERQEVDLASEIGVIRAYFETAAAEAGLRLSTHLVSGVSLNVDRTLFQRAVSNLLANAIAHTPRGGEVAIVLTLYDERVVIEVADNGEGVPAEAQARVFDRFYRVDAARTSTSGRIGLGLPIAKSIMELHGGSIVLRSTPGQGTVVALSFPR